MAPARIRRQPTAVLAIRGTLLEHVIQEQISLRINVAGNITRLVGRCAEYRGRINVDRTTINCPVVAVGTEPSNV